MWKPGYQVLIVKGPVAGYSSNVTLRSIRAN